MGDYNGRSLESRDDGLVAVEGEHVLAKRKRISPLVLVFEKNGAAGRNRTSGPALTKGVLYP